MGLILMKIITWFLSPLAIALGGMLVSGYWIWRDKVRRGLWSLFASFLWLWIWSTPAFFLLIGMPLEKRYPPTPVKEVPTADAIVVLGGGMTSPGTHLVHPELFSGGDRGWHAARCFHAKKAPYILFSGIAEGPGMKQFLLDLGVPRDSIILESYSKNTYENGTFTRDKLKELNAKRVILITSAWHLRRAEMTFRAMDVDVIPVGTDYEAYAECQRGSYKTPANYFPSANHLHRNSTTLKEYIGYWAYKSYLLVRRKK